MPRSSGSCTGCGRSACRVDSRKRPSVRGAALKGGSERAGALALLSTPVADGIARLTSALTPISPRRNGGP